MKRGVFKDKYLYIKKLSGMFSLAKEKKMECSK